MSYSILTYCSRAYERAFRWVLPSWSRKEVERIIVVSDFCPEAQDNAVAEWHPIYSPSEDWLTNNCRRAEIAAHHLPDGNVAFLDLDCWIRGDLSEVFGPPGTIAVTRFWSKEWHTDGTITDGTWFANVDESVREFCREWDRRVKANPYTNTCVGGAVTQQYRFTELCREAYKTGKPCRIQTVPEQLFNCEHSVREEVLTKCRAFHPSLIHFKGGQWKDAAFVDEAIACAEGLA